MSANFMFLTSRPQDIEQKRRFFELRTEISEAIYSRKTEDLYVGMTATLGD